MPGKFPLVTAAQTIFPRPKRCQSISTATGSTSGLRENWGSLTLTFMFPLDEAMSGSW
jgi:hypothetical protein